MSSIKVCVKIRPLSQRDIKLKKEEQWKVTDNKSLKCENILHPCDFNFDHIFGTQSLNYEVYLWMVKPIVESSLLGFNGTILTYGPTSAGKSYTMLGTDADPGILLVTMERLFKTDGFFHRTIRFGYIEIYKEKIYDLFNDRHPLFIDQNEEFDFLLSNSEIAVESFENAEDILLNHCKLSSISHSIFRITIESENRKSGKMQISYLRFVHVAGCEQITEIPLSDASEDESTKSLYWLNALIDGLNKGEENISFNNSVLTTLLGESMSSSNTAIICNIRPDVVEETISTLKFVSRAKNVRTLPMRHIIHNAPARCSTPVNIKMTHVEHQLKEDANTKIENFLLRKELDDVKAAFAAKTIWFEEQMKSAEFAQQKLEHIRSEEKKSFERIQKGLKANIKKLADSNEYLRGKLDAQHQYTTAHSLRKRSEFPTLSQSKYSTLTRKDANYLEEQQLDTDATTPIKRKVDGLANGWTNHGRAHNKADVKPPTDEWNRTRSSNQTESRIVAVPNCRIGCVIGVGGAKLKWLTRATGTRIVISPYERDSCRTITIHGNKRSVCMAVHMIQQMFEYDD